MDWGIGSEGSETGVGGGGDGVKSVGAAPATRELVSLRKGGVRRSLTSSLRRVGHAWIRGRVHASGWSHAPRRRHGWRSRIQSQRFRRLADCHCGSRFLGPVGFPGLNPRLPQHVLYLPVNGPCMATGRGIPRHVARRRHEPVAMNCRHAPAPLARRSAKVHPMNRKNSLRYLAAIIGLAVIYHLGHAAGPSNGLRAAEHVSGLAAFRHCAGCALTPWDLGLAGDYPGRCGGIFAHWGSSRVGCRIWRG